MNFEKQKTYEFNSEVKQLLNLMIHSLYSNKEIFLRELISNSSDALDKLRFKAILDNKIYKNDNNLHIRISCNKDKNTITVSDNGIGMTYDEVINNLGTIAKSGTKDFIKNINNNYTKEQNNLIGKFGVGFYSAFIVAKKVIVITKSINSNNNQAVFWESKGDGKYNISYFTKNDRGTDVTLYLNKKDTEFLEENKITELVNKYSEHINLPIEFLYSEKNNNSISSNWKKINNSQAIWCKNKKDISKEDYKNFYKHLFKDQNDPIIWIHNRVEGKQEYISLLYIPAKSVSDIWNRDNYSGLKLYVKKIFIMDSSKEFIPNYLRFIKGILDTNNLSLNISREIVQKDESIIYLKKVLTKRILFMLEKLSINHPKKYLIFWNQFGTIFKEGLAEDIKNKDIISKLLRFSSTYNNDKNNLISLDDYIKRMIKKQNKIYYITSDNYESARNHPHLELCIENKIEVLLLSDRIDEWMINYIPKYNEKIFHSINQPDDFLDTFIKHPNDKINEKKINFLVNKIKNYLKDRVKDVKVTYRLKDYPAVVVTESNNITTQMAKLISLSGQKAPKIKYILKINPNHNIIKYIKNLNDEILFTQVVDILLYQALLIETGYLNKPNNFVKLINNFLIKS